jgi:hypothetical protein
VNKGYVPEAAVESLINIPASIAEPFKEKLDFVNKQRDSAECAQAQQRLGTLFVKSTSKILDKEEKSGIPEIGKLYSRPMV